jgi:5-methylcytosine-specific restriction protein A
MASGFAVSLPFRAPHYSDASKTANYIDLRYDILLNPSYEKLLGRDILEEELPEVRWSPQGSGITIPPHAAARLEEMWSDQIASIGLSPSKSPDEIVAPERYWEGAVRRITVDAYERDPRARKACLKYHGLTCCVCGFDFAKTYGDLGEGFIHVHHLQQLSDIGSEYEVNPISDLVPVCPNCHAMLHKRNPPLSPVDLRIAIKLASKPCLVTDDKPAS